MALAVQSAKDLYGSLARDIHEDLSSLRKTIEAFDCSDVTRQDLETRRARMMKLLDEMNEVFTAYSGAKIWIADRGMPQDPAAD